VIAQLSSSVNTLLNSTASTIEKDIKILSTDSVTDLRKCDTILADCQSVLNLKEKEHADLVLLLSQSSQENINSITQSIKSTETLTTQTLRSSLEELGSTSDDSINFASAHYSQHGQIQEGVNTFKYQPYIPSGTTPLKKAYDYPHKLTHTRPEPEVLNSYRQQSLDSSSFSENLPLEIISTIPSSPEMEEDLSIDFMDTPPEQPLLRASLPPNNPKIKPNHNPINKRESKPTDLLTVVNTLRTTTNPPLKGRTTTTTKDNTHRRKPSVGSKTENPIVVFGKPSLNGKERNRLADLTNQVKS
jgi:hypothetical protein